MLTVAHKHTGALTPGNTHTDVLTQDIDVLATGWPVSMIYGSWVNTRSRRRRRTWFQDGSEAGGGGAVMPTEETLKPMDWLRFPNTAAWPRSSAMDWSSTKAASSGGGGDGLSHEGGVTHLCLGNTLE